MTKQLTYAGIGSRKTPTNALTEMTVLAEQLNALGCTLRTGGALGADTAFYDGVPETSELIELYLPWQGYNDYESMHFEPSKQAMQIAADVHPNWDACSSGTRKLMARNVHIILGEDLNTPVDFVICYTPHGAMSGGTAHALFIAEDYGIPIFNLGNGIDAAIAELEDWYNAD